jgi:hypothetical protein
MKFKVFDKCRGRTKSGDEVELSAGRTIDILPEKALKLINEGKDHIC